jgi:hypothetical protein
MSNPYKAAVEDDPTNAGEVPVPTTEGESAAPPAGAPPTGETRPQPSEDGRITIKVRDSQGGEVTFKVKPVTKMGKLMSAYCEKHGKAPASVRFLFDGTRVTENDTPASVRVIFLPPRFFLHSKYPLTSIS